MNLRRVRLDFLRRHAAAFRGDPRQRADFHLLFQHRLRIETLLGIRFARGIPRGKIFSVNENSSIYQERVYHIGGHNWHDGLRDRARLPLRRTLPGLQDNASLAGKSESNSGHD